MNSFVKYAAVLLSAAFLLCIATFILVPRMRNSDSVGNDAARLDSEMPQDAREGGSAARSRRIRERHGHDAKSVGMSAKTREEHDREKHDVAEMRTEVEDMLRKFRGTQKERQDVIDECESGKALILAIMDATVDQYDTMSPEELQKARDEFEEEYRAQLDYLQTGRLQQMLKTPEEQEVIGSTLDVAQQFLETLDNALIDAGY